MCARVCVCQALDVNGLGSFECQHFVRITSNLSRAVFEGVDGWGLQDCHELIKLSMRTTLERAHSSDIVRAHTHTHTNVWDSGNPLVLRQTVDVSSLTFFLLYLTCLDDVRAPKHEHK